MQKPQRTFAISLHLLFAVLLGSGCTGKEINYADGDRPCLVEGTDPECPEGWYCRTGEKSPDSLRCYYASSDSDGTDADGSSGTDSSIYFDSDSHSDSIQPAQLHLNRIGLVVTGETGGFTSWGSQEQADIAGKLTFANNHVYIANGYAGLQIVNVTDPASAILAGELPVELATSVAVDGTRAFLVQREEQWYNTENPWAVADDILLVDVQDASTPQIVGTYRTYCLPSYWCMTSSLEAADGTVYAGSHKDLSAIDGSHPDLPTLSWIMSADNNAEYTGGLALDGGFLYHAFGENGVQVVDISIPGEARLIASVDTPGPARDIVVRDGFAFVAVGNAGVIVLDVSAPANPTLAGSFEMDGYIRRMDISDNALYLVYRNYDEGDAYSTDPPGVIDEGIVGVDIRDMTRLIIVCADNTLILPSDVIVHGNYVFVHDSNGLHIFQEEYEQ
ncbi:MAG: hypothetical protein JXX29_14320 [Deltaproteobacteria bacterium]|nr:hypothetical protein [Deltaproteobacteria bacterium]MBN2672854.1 hypothetical protein [Deltaproteobacteria bacterium]